MKKADITELPFDDETFDLIWCSHVLEHVVDDRRAMAELFRVLQQGGTAVIQVPIWREGATFEDPAITTPEGRLASFHQADHVRLYGFDIVDRLSDVGFSVQIRTVRRLPAEAIVRHSLDYLPTNEVILCTR